jgi:uncharacterized protein YlxP (DUF503 family)
MVVGVMSIYAQLHEPVSLKDKRRVIKSVLAKVQNRFNMSAAEVDYQDEWHRTALGFSCVSNEAAHADSMLGAVLRFLESDPEMEIYDVATEVIHI